MRIQTIGLFVFAVVVHGADESRKMSHELLEEFSVPQQQESNGNTLQPRITANKSEDRLLEQIGALKVDFEVNYVRLMDDAFAEVAIWEKERGPNYLESEIRWEFGKLDPLKAVFEKKCNEVLEKLDEKLQDKHAEIS